MSPVKTKKSPKGEKIYNDADLKRLTRKPLYPDLNEEKENMGFSSSDDSPEKLPYSHSPRMPRKSNSPSSSDSMSDIPGSPKPRSGRHQENQMNKFQDNMDSDVGIEAEKNVDPNYLHSPGQEKSKIYFEEKMKTRKRKSSLSKMPPPKTEPSAGSSNSNHSFVYLILLGIILFICIILIINTFWLQQSGTSSITDQFNATSLVNNLKSKFETQPPLTFRIIYHALKNVLEKQPEAPALILLLSTNGSETVCGKLAHSLVDLLPVHHHTVKISGKNYRKANTTHAKKEIDVNISNALTNDQLGSVLIEDMDQIPGKAAMILHKYSDHENAPFKKAVFVMTVNYSKEVSNYSDTKLWDKAAYDHLLSVWTDVGIDQATPLLTRLTVSVAVIRA